MDILDSIQTWRLSLGHSLKSATSRYKTYLADLFALPPTALPHLETLRLVHVDLDTLEEVRTCTSELVPLISVRLGLMEHLTFPTASRGGHTPHLVLQPCMRCTPSPFPDIDPIRRLTPLIIDAPAPNELLQLAAHLPHLVALHIVIIVGQCNLVCIPLSSLLYHSFGYTHFVW